MISHWLEFKIVIFSVMMLVLPGWAILASTGYWRKIKTFERWILAICIGLAFYPLLFYWARLTIPSLRIGENKLWLLLAVSLIIIIWKFRYSWRDQFKFGEYWLLIFVVLAITLFTRFKLADQHPYPAWSDSLHHTILTELTAIHGKLPFNMLPYDGAVLDEYHLGLYALTGSLKILARVPAHTALLWFSQLLNAFCVLGIFAVLDRNVSRMAGIVGMIVVGLLNFQPAQYFNWGRFTQLSGQTLLLSAALLIWDAISLGRDKEKSLSRLDWQPIFLGAMLLAGIAALHFRVATFLLSLVIVIFVFEIAQSKLTKKERLLIFQSALMLGLIVLIFILPVFVPAITSYLTEKPAHVAVGDNLNNSNNLKQSVYFSSYNAETIFQIGVNKAVAILSMLGILCGLLTRELRKTTLAVTIWALLLTGIGLLYLLNIRKLAIINLTGVMITAYLLAGLLIGIFCQSLVIKLTNKAKAKIEIIILVIFFVLGIKGAIDRSKQVELHRHFLGNGDIVAMKWIEQNIPQEATFGINSAYWMKPYSFHGDEGGYWLPYFTGRKTNVGTMISSFDPNFDRLIIQTKAVMDFYENPESTAPLCESGIDFLYDGQNPPYTGQSFEKDVLLKLENTQLIYDVDGVQIYDICP